ncbi:hypothetical protein CEXT_79061 [Caerostris extrusa]|uniref:Uncharacterized protein n=1 Tax=Caerostris extrusa TaxID=172846 RepID=A0AAV4PM74_CAEEX|nr:hypothetical protein CEXT_79061 [Caerostris extrusa]
MSLDAPERQKGMNMEQFSSVLQRLANFGNKMGTEDSDVYETTQLNSTQSTKQSLSHYLHHSGSRMRSKTFDIGEINPLNEGDIKSSAFSAHHVLFHPLEHLPSPLEQNRIPGVWENHY